MNLENLNLVELNNQECENTLGGESWLDVVKKGVESWIKNWLPLS